MRPAKLRRLFLAELWSGLGVVWPILSGLIGLQLALGMLAGHLEGWRIGQTAYFTFVTGLTIGYGDVVPQHWGGRVIAVMIGFLGILVTALIGAVGVRALQQAARRTD